jgi:hypothetical protein
MGPRGVGPLTFAMSTQRSNQLSYEPVAIALRATLEEGEPEAITLRATLEEGEPLYFQWARRESDPHNLAVNRF